MLLLLFFAVLISHPLFCLNSTFAKTTKKQDTYAHADTVQRRARGKCLEEPSMSPDRSVLYSFGCLRVRSGASGTVLNRTDEQDVGSA
uniref:Secreted protein n=1 Tax=Anguilla anguilla TaxID=7936 RepID=A0A0E9PEK5_ANGAN